MLKKRERCKKEVNVKVEKHSHFPSTLLQVLKDRERRKKEANAEVERQAKLKELDAVVARLVQQEGGDGGGGGEGGEAMQRDLSLGISGEEAFLRRGKMGAGGAGGGGGRAGAGAGAGDGGEEGGGMSKAQRMLEKMGWKEGGRRGVWVHGVNHLKGL